MNIPDMASTTNDLRVLVVSDDPLARAGLVALLAGQPDCTVVGQVAVQLDLLADIAVYHPDVVLWDLGWDSSISASSLERLADLQEESLPVVALVNDEAHAAEAWGAGARGLLFREVDAETLMTALKTVAQNLMVFSPEIATAARFTQDRTPVPLVEELTPREMQVLRLLAEGLPNKSIAQRLDISEHTVKFHVAAIMGKFGAQSRTEVVILATRHGLILL